MIVKKYANRRLYDSAQSRYITLEELAGKIREGHEVRVVDATTDADLTQTTLAQIILEGRGAAYLLPIPLLQQLVRLQDDALAEFFGRYLTVALDTWLRARQTSQQVSQWNPWLGQALQQVGRVVPGWPFSSAAPSPPRPWGSPYGPGQAPETASPEANWQASQAAAQAVAQAVAQAEAADRADLQKAAAQYVAQNPDTVGFSQPGPAGPSSAPAQPLADDLAALRRELAELRTAVAANKPKRGRPAKTTPK